MDKEKQIEEMAKDIYATGIAIDGTDIAYGIYDNDDHFHRMARKLYAAGYRKQSDTVREFAGKLLEKIQSFCFSLIGREIKMKIMETVGEFGAEVEK